MKYIVNILLMNIMLAAIGYSCSNTKEDETNNSEEAEEVNKIISILAGECPDEVSFMEVFPEIFQRDNVYFIKGIASDFEHCGGRNIKLIEDLKGNFPENVTTFVVWGAYDSHYSNFLNRLDLLIHYDNQDILLMLLTSAPDWTVIFPPDWAEFLPPDQPIFEKIGDYATISCLYSVIKLSDDGYVTGHILPYKEKEDIWWENMSREEISSFLEKLSPKERYFISMDTMPWDELQERLQEILKSNMP